MFIRCSDGSSSCYSCGSEEKVSVEKLVRVVIKKALKNQGTRNNEIIIRCSSGCGGGSCSCSGCCSGGYNNEYVVFDMSLIRKSKNKVFRY